MINTTVCLSLLIHLTEKPSFQMNSNTQNIRSFFKHSLPNASPIWATGSAPLIPSASPTLMLPQLSLFQTCTPMSPVFLNSIHLLQHFMTFGLPDLLNCQLFIQLFHINAKIFFLLPAVFVPFFTKCMFKSHTLFWLGTSTRKSLCEWILLGYLHFSFSNICSTSSWLTKWLHLFKNYYRWSGIR